MPINSKDYFYKLTLNSSTYILWSHNVKEHRRLTNSTWT